MSKVGVCLGRGGIGMGKHILIVDDQPNIQHLLTTVFTREGFVSTTARSGKEVLLLLEEQEPDCILLDYQLQGMNGLEILREIKNDYPHIPVMMMSGYGEGEWLEKAYSLGLKKHFAKPFDVFEMLETVKNFFCKADYEKW